MRGRPRKAFNERILEHLDFGMRLEDCQNMAKAVRITGKTKRDILRESLKMYSKWLDKYGKL